MKRRSFLELLASNAVASGLPVSVCHGRTQRSAVSILDGVDQSYAHFCATPESARVFHALRGGAIVREQLNVAMWQPNDVGQLPELPLRGGSHDGVPMQAPIRGLAGDGPYRPTWASLSQYECPEWYRDAKFGIWNHWSPQCVPEDGDWYARNMYVEGQEQYRHHREHYGPPSKLGYKDLCAQWTLEHWDAPQLMQLYKKAGARLFLALANHHDGFDTWNSKHHPWNAHNIGPRRDVIGTWARAAREQGLRFGVTVHQARNWWWFQTAHAADTTGPFAGDAYDGRLTLADGKGQWWEGLDPQQLYGPKHPVDALPELSYVKHFYDRTRDLVDQHDPDLLYFDNSLLPLGWAGMCIGAYFYNRSLARHHSAVEAVINVKDVPAALRGAVVSDIERGLNGDIEASAWQSETCIGEWHYQRKLFDQPGEFGGYMHPRNAIHWMIDTVSKNGTFILNIPGRPDGTLDTKEVLILEKIGGWLNVNGEAIYGTRPWKVYGEGPTAVRGGSFQGNSVNTLSAQDIRFTRNKAGTVVYAITLGWPENAVVAHSLGTAAPTMPGRVEHVELLGTEMAAAWQQTADGLRVVLPNHRPDIDYAAAIKIHLAARRVADFG